MEMVLLTCSSSFFISGLHLLKLSLCLARSHAIICLTHCFGNVLFVPCCWSISWKDHIEFQGQGCRLLKIPTIKTVYDSIKVLLAHIGNLSFDIGILPVNKITEALDNGDYVVGVFPDFSRAFDTIDHTLFHWIDVLFVASRTYPYNVLKIIWLGDLSR